jgi:hypothetical protein
MYGYYLVLAYINVLTTTRSSGYAAERRKSGFRGDFDDFLFFPQAPGGAGGGVLRGGVKARVGGR